VSRALDILEVVPYWAPAWAYGGPPKVMSEEARELVRRGHHVRAFTTDALDEHHRVEGPLVAVEDGVDVHRFPNLSNWLAYHRYRFQPRGMRRALRSIRPDVVHLSELRHELAILSWREAKRRGLPFVVSAHGTLPRQSGFKARIKREYDRLFVDGMLRGSAAVFAQTAHEARLYADYGVDEAAVHVVPLGTDEPPPPTAEGSPDLGVPDGARVVLFLGRIHRLKGVARLITAFASVAHEHDDTWLVIAGRDDGGQADAEALAHQLGIGERVTFPGAIYGAPRFDAYRRASLFAITPIHFEETSLASLEAASVGTPLLLGAEAEAPFLTEYSAGALVAAGDDIAPSLNELLSRDLTDAGRNAARMVQERHVWSTVGEVVETIFEKVS
jgi:glycosyltransferase involved in cell wall biosynthesis